MLQANSLLLINMFSVLVAPLMATFVLDESCLRSWHAHHCHLRVSAEMWSIRYYLSFADNLRSILEEWGIGQQGFGAYRPQFCSRRLVVAYSYGTSKAKRYTLTVDGCFSVGEPACHLCTWQTSHRAHQVAPQGAALAIKDNSMGNTHCTKDKIQSTRRTTRYARSL